MNASSELEDFHFKFKISIVGDTSVGKTTFLDGKTRGTILHSFYQQSARAWGRSLKTSNRPNYTQR